jgi:7-cyano-7-deazaguanine synthase
METGIVILSGGMDSTTLAYYLHKMYEFDWHYLSFDYGQRHVKELSYAAATAETLGARHDVINLQQIGKLMESSESVLVNLDMKVPEGHYAEESMKATVVPNRNSIMLAIACGVAVAEQATFVAAGMHAGDHFIYPDCRPEFVTAFEQAEALANDGFWEARLYTPFIELTKTTIVGVGEEFGVPWNGTWSCYVGGAKHCGKCGTCNERREAFSLAGVVDPTEYE